MYKSLCFSLNVNTHIGELIDFLLVVLYVSSIALLLCKSCFQPFLLLF
uniref:Uncharacterized protein n=1 Tax=Anopheles arabiensis TaxID=7173 RepID=A0A182IGS6_ANOAR